MVHAILFLAALAAPAPAAPKLAVMDLAARVGVTKDLAQTLTDELVARVRERLPDTKILGSDDVRAMLSLQRQKERMGCEDVGCLAEIGGAMGAARMVVGSLARLGETYSLEVRLIDATHAVVMRQSSQKLRGKTDDALFDAVRAAVLELFPVATVAVPEAAVTAPPEGPRVSRSHLLSYVLWGGAAVGAGLALGGLLGPVQSYQSAKSNHTPESAGQGASLVSNANAWGDVAIVATVAAAAAVAGGVIAW